MRPAPPDQPLGIYVHVPFCATRCGYCDFNTYTASELRGVTRSDYAGAAIAEVRLAARALGSAAPAVSTVFFGGGTPTLLPAGDLGAILQTVDAELGLAPGAEVTVEANPETVDPKSLAALRAAGVNRISLGMQSAAPHVLATLDRVHTSGRPLAAAREARAAGFAHVSLDLIYGTPGETAEDWERSLDAALSAEPDHISAYALTVEPGTKLAARVRRGEVAAVDEDVQADRYEAADAALSAAGLRWYEISNWAVDGASRCLHNVGYWRSASWWGIGPGAHSHVAGVRWWNVRHPADYAARLAAGESPAAGHEELDTGTRHFERVMLELRLSDGLDPALLDEEGRAAAGAMRAEGLLEEGDPLRLTLRGRLLADRVVRRLT